MKVHVCLYTMFVYILFGCWGSAMRGALLHVHITARKKGLFNLAMVISVVAE